MNRRMSLTRRGTGFLLVHEETIEVQTKEDLLGYLETKERALYACKREIERQTLTAQALEAEIKQIKAELGLTQ